jgi:hypothetical protein
MSRQTIFRPAAALTLALAGLMPAAAAPTPIRSALKSVYHVRLTSTWPQERLEGGCRNGGEETVEGTLTRAADGRYTGTFVRRTELRFCGAHGGAPAAAAPPPPPPRNCELLLTGQGEVSATGVVREDETSPSGHEIRLAWMPAPGHEAEVSGACAPAFKDAVRAMYLSTPHAAEFPLTPAGSGPRTERLENYAWTVELR